MSVSNCRVKAYMASPRSERKFGLWRTRNSCYWKLHNILARWTVIMSLLTEASTSFTVWWRWMTAQLIRRSKSSWSQRTDQRRNSLRSTAQLWPTCCRCQRRFWMSWTWRSTTHQTRDDWDWFQLWGTAERLGKSRWDLHHYSATWSWSHQFLGFIHTCTV